MRNCVVLILIVAAALPTFAQDGPKRAEGEQVISFTSGSELPEIKLLEVDAQENCVFMTQTVCPDDVAVRTALKPGQAYSVIVRGEAYMSQHSGRKADPMPGVVVFYSAHGQDGHEIRCSVLKSGDEIHFRAPRPKQKKEYFLSAFFVDYWPRSKNRGAYHLQVSEIDDVLKTQREDADQQAQTTADGFALNLTFGDDPGQGRYDGAIGHPNDSWNCVRAGTRKIDGLRLANGKRDDVSVRISENDGGWGVNGHEGVFHGYIYHNCRCVDLAVTLQYVPAGLYEVLVYAHGDAPNQNAAVEIQSAGVTYQGRSTLNNDTWKFQDTDFREGNQYVRYVIEVSDQPVVITNKRDGSDYSMFNAIQLRRLPL